MAIDSKPSSSPFEPSVADLLACPVCLGSLSAEGLRLVCAACGRAYPVVDGIPVLIAERATAPNA